MHHVLGFLHHLALRDPQRGSGHGHGKVVDLNAVELANGNLDGVANIQNALPVVQQGKRFVLQPPQGDVGFRQEVAGAAGRVEEFQPGQLPLKLLQLCFAGALHRDRR